MMNMPSTPSLRQHVSLLCLSYFAAKTQAFSFTLECNAAESLTVLLTGDRCQDDVSTTPTAHLPNSSCHQQEWESSASLPEGTQVRLISQDQLGREVFRLHSQVGNEIDLPGSSLYQLDIYRRVLETVDEHDEDEEDKYVLYQRVGYTRPWCTDVRRELLHELGAVQVVAIHDGDTGRTLSPFAVIGQKEEGNEQQQQEAPSAVFVGSPVNSKVNQTASDMCQASVDFDGAVVCTDDGPMHTFASPPRPQVWLDESRF